MTYTTGAAASPAALISALLSFAQTDLWTDVSGDWPISKGKCHVMVDSVVRASQSDYTTGVNVPDSKTQLVGTLGTSLPGTKPSPWYGMPGSIVTSDTDADIPYAWDIENALISHHFFSDAGEDYIHVVMQTAADKWAHFSFGNIDKKGLTHDGVAYLTSCLNPTWPNSSSTSAIFNDPDNYWWPFNGAYGRVATGSARMQYFAGNAVISPYVTGIIGTATNVAEVGLNSITSGITAWLVKTSHARFLLHNLVQVPTGYNGTVVLSAIPCFLADTTNAKITYVGDFPGVRVCRMDGLTPGQEITFGGDTWKIFPLTRQTNPSEVSQQYVVSTGPLGLAYKKVV